MILKNKLGLMVMCIFLLGNLSQAAYSLDGLGMKFIIVNLISVVGTYLVYRFMIEEIEKIKLGIIK